DTIDHSTCSSDRYLYFSLQHVHKVSGIGTVPVRSAKNGIIKASMIVNFAFEPSLSDAVSSNQKKKRLPCIAILNTVSFLLRILIIVVKKSKHRSLFV
ncbi:hypothetical protein PHYBLDRAFT_107160, partial [Phycomyces blakesleeanus NRRL 1555(-)]